jgi:hypothetical protein
MDRCHTADCTGSLRAEISIPGNAESFNVPISCLQRRFQGIKESFCAETSQQEKTWWKKHIRRVVYSLLLYVKKGINFPPKLRGQKIFLNGVWKTDTRILRNTVCVACSFPRNYFTDARAKFEFLKAALIMCEVFWDVTFCRRVSSSRRFDRSVTNYLPNDNA